MSPSQLIEKLETLGIIDQKILNKIKQEIDNPNKTVKSKSILSYLVKKSLITESQAVQLLKGTPEKTDDLKPVDEFEEIQPPAEPNYDTSVLTGIPSIEPKEEIAPQPESQPPEEEVEVMQVTSRKIKQEQPSDATIMDDGMFRKNDDVIEILPTNVPSQAQFDEDLGEPEIIETGDVYANVDAGLDDYIAGEDSAVKAFLGKRDKKDQWATKWLYIGFGILGFLLIMGAVLWIATMGVAAEEQFKAAMDSFEKSAFQDAVAKFDQYIEENPKHKHVPTAKARRVQSILAGFYTSKNWAETITSADTLLPELDAEEDSKLEIIRDDLAVMLPRSLFEITEKGKKLDSLTDLEKELKNSQQYKKTIDNPIYIPGSQRKKPSIAANLAKIENNIRLIEGRINKENDYNIAISEIKTLGEAGETDSAFAGYKKLIRNYPDLRGRQELRDEMLKISVKERELVKPYKSEVNVLTDKRDSPIQMSIVLAAKTGKEQEMLTGEVINFMAEGSVYGIDAGSGTILWRKFVGLETTTQPVELDKDSFLVVNQHHHDLMLLPKTTGETIWRAEINEPFNPPQFNDNQIVVTTKSGSLLRIDRSTGEIGLSAKLPQTANVGALVADRAPFVYQTGMYSNLYVLSNQDFSCREVYYLGHYKGSIAIPPKNWRGYILVAINGGDYCDLMVLKPAQNGLELETVQVIPRVTNGLVTTPLQNFGRWMLITSDNGEIRILELNTIDEDNPVRKFAGDRFDNSGGQTAFVQTSGSNLWIASQGLSKFRIQRTLGQFKREEIVNHADSFLSPMRKLDDTLFHVRRRKGSGMLSATLADANTLEPIWRTDFGGQLAGAPIPIGDSLGAVSGQGDYFRLGQENFANQYSEDPVQASTVVNDLKFESILQVGDDSYVALGPGGKQDFLHIKPSRSENKLMQLESPADKPTGHGLVVAGDLIITSTSGQVTRVNPETGRTIGIPFQPPISPGSETEWFEPTLIQGGLFAAATGNGKLDNEISVLYLLDASDESAVKEVAALEADNPIKSRLVTKDGVVFATVEGGLQDQLISVVAGEQLSIANKLDLPGRLVGGPWLLDEGILVKMDNDQLLLVEADVAEMKIKWAMDVANDQFAGAPENIGSQILLTYKSGKMVVVEPSSGQIVTEYDLEQPIIHNATRVGQGSVMYFSGMDGTVHTVDFSKLSK